MLYNIIHLYTLVYMCIDLCTLVYTCMHVYTFHTIVRAASKHIFGAYWLSCKRIQQVFRILCNLAKCVASFSRFFYLLSWMKGAGVLCPTLNKVSLRVASSSRHL